MRIAIEMPSEMETQVLYGLAWTATQGTCGRIGARRYALFANVVGLYFAFRLLYNWRAESQIQFIYDKNSLNVNDRRTVTVDRHYLTVRPTCYLSKFPGYLIYSTLGDL